MRDDACRMHIRPPISYHGAAQIFNPGGFSHSFPMTAAPRAERLALAQEPLGGRTASLDGVLETI